MAQLKYKLNGEWVPLNLGGAGSGEQYKLPVATQDTLGGVSIGEGIDITPEGKISVKTPSSPAESVLYTAQELTEEQKAQARQNIGSFDIFEIPNLIKFNVKSKAIFGDNIVEGQVFALNDFQPIDIDTADAETVEAWRTLFHTFSFKDMQTLLGNTDMYMALASLIDKNMFGENFYSTHISSNCAWFGRNHKFMKFYSWAESDPAQKIIAGYVYDLEKLVGQFKYKALNNEIEYFSYSCPLTASADTSTNGKEIIKQINMSANPTEPMQIATKQYVDNAITNIPATDLSNCVQTDKENILGDNGSIISNSSRGNSLTISNGVIEQKNGNQDTVSLGDAKVVFSHDNDGSSSTKGNGTFTMYGRKGEEYFKFKGTNGDVRVSGIATPTLSNDAVNKGYVDLQIANIEIPTVPTNVSAFTNDAGYLTAVPSEYITETELNAKGYLTEHQSLADYALKSEIPSPYSLPTASATALGGIKVGAGLAIADDGTLSSNGAERIKYNFHSATLTDEDKAVLKEIIKNPVGDFTFDDFQVIDLYKTESAIMFGVMQAKYNRVYYYGIIYRGNDIIDNKWQLLKQLYLSENQITGEILTADNFNNYFDQNFGWRIGSSSSEIYNAKELCLFYQRTDGGNAFGTAYYNFRADDGIHNGNLSDYIYSKFVLFYSPISQSNVFWQYNGNDFELSTSDVSIERILYKS